MRKEKRIREIKNFQEKENKNTSQDFGSKKNPTSTKTTNENFFEREEQTIAKLLHEPSEMKMALTVNLFVTAVIWVFFSNMIHIVLEIHGTS